MAGSYGEGLYGDGLYGEELPDIAYFELQLVKARSFECGLSTHFEAALRLSKRMRTDSERDDG